MVQLDHLAVTAPTLAEGVTHVEQALGVSLVEGGRHPGMGTHNRLLKLGERLYLEVIAVDPQLPAPARPRWFGLSVPVSAPRLSSWVARVADLGSILTKVPLPLGSPVSLERGPYSWRMAVPDDGSLPMGGAAPMLLQWESRNHPASALPDAGCSLLRLDVSHPQADLLLTVMPCLKRLKTVRIETGPLDISARIETPTGRWTLS